MLTKEWMGTPGNEEYLKEYEYDRYGRLVAQSMNRFNADGTAKKQRMTYDSLGRVRKVVSDNVTEEITLNELENAERIGEVTTTITDGKSYYSYITQTKYTAMGSPIYSIDRDGYKYQSKHDRFGNIVEATKSTPDGIGGYKTISTNLNSYDTTGIFLKTSDLLETNIEDSMGQPIASIDKRYTYNYDSRGRVSEIVNSNLAGAIATEITKRVYTYDNAHRITHDTLTVGTEQFTKQYTYDTADRLKEMIYPGGKKLVPTYHPTYNDGTVEKVKFGNRTIVDEIEYFNEDSVTTERKGTLKSYRTGLGVTTAFDHDALGRVNMLSFTKGNGVQTLTQNYSYDRAGNITAINEALSGSVANSQDAIVKETYNRVFNYDSYNRLTKAEYKGNFLHELATDLTYISKDYQPTELPDHYAALPVDNDRVENIEKGASSVLLTAKDKTGGQFKPEIIRINKTGKGEKASRLTQKHIKLFYENNGKFQVIDDSSVHLHEENSELIELKADNLDFTKLLKMNFSLNDTDLDNAEQITSGEAAKLGDQFQLFITADTIGIEYEYDELGNITSTKQSLTKAGVEVKGETKSFKYNEKKQLIEDNEFKYEYDNKGRQIKKFNKDNSIIWKYIWNAADEMIRVEKYHTDPANNEIEDYSESYTYDEGGQRVKSVEGNNAVVTDYVYNGLKLIYEKKVDSSGTDPVTTVKELVYALGVHQATIEKVDNGEDIAYYHHNDLIGTTRFVWDSRTNNTKQENIVSPYGKPLLTRENLAGTGKSHMKWAGHDSINENTGLTYMQARWMDNNTGRFISMDPIKDGFNWYAYCAGNPVTYVDPTGLYYVNDEPAVGQKNVGGGFVFDESLFNTRDYTGTWGFGALSGNGSSNGWYSPQFGMHASTPFNLKESLLPYGHQFIKDNTVKNPPRKPCMTAAQQLYDKIRAAHNGSVYEELVDRLKNEPYHGNDDSTAAFSTGNSIGDYIKQAEYEDIKSKTRERVINTSQDAEEYRSMMTDTPLLDFSQTYSSQFKRAIGEERTDESYLIQLDRSIRNQMLANKVKRGKRLEWIGRDGKLDWGKIGVKMLAGAGDAFLADVNSATPMGILKQNMAVFDFIMNMKADPNYLGELLSGLSLNLNLQGEGIGHLLKGDFDKFTECWTPEEVGAFIYRVIAMIAAAKVASKLTTGGKTSKVPTLLDDMEDFSLSRKLTECFVAGTLVLTANGTKPIEEIEAGDLVYAKNVQTGEEGLKEVVVTFARETETIFCLQTENEEIETTDEHPFWVVGRGFVVARELKEGDRLEIADGRTVKLLRVEVEHFDEPVAVYNFRVADWSTYYVGEDSVLVHNAKCPLTGKEFKKRVSGKSGKEAAKGVPSWVTNEGYKPYVGENGKQFATRVLNERYGVGNYPTKGGGTDFNKLRKWGDRGFE